MILTDDDIKAIYDNEKGGDYYDTVWAIEAAILAKLSSVEPVYQWRRIAGDGRWRDSTKEEAYASVDDFYEARTLFTHPPAPSAVEAVELLRRAAISIGEFVSDQGWTQSDMDTMDSIDAYLFRLAAARSEK